ncbi:uncharacterized protein Hcs isoform X2 [Chironomus tepperi]|uniref:uncharacterized protein Hcs isoform X2 n=1 Tax=Chironomus tepperi TaxID=113505 RepID=UPI00391F75FD
MLLTVFYLTTTSFQSWRLRAIHQKISRAIDTKNSVVFVKKSDGNRECMVTALASSDICVNSSEATVQDCFWSNDISQGISISPKQILYINPFITFPTPPSLIPFSYSVKSVPEITKNDVIHALIEAELVPETNLSLPVLEIEAFTHMLAWKIDTKLSVLVKTSSKHLSQLIFATFAQNQYVINDHLILSRIQTVNVEGNPQDYDQIVTHSKHHGVRRFSELLSPIDWDKHLEEIRNLGVLANQASEFEYKKNLTEGKTGIVQPDLISSKNIEESLNRKPILSPTTPKRSFVSMEKTDEKLRELKQELKKQKDTSNLPNSSYDHKKIEEVVTPDSPKFPVSPAKSINHASKSKVISDSVSPKFPLSSPAKNSFFGEKVAHKAAPIDLPETNNVVKNLTETVTDTTKSYIETQKPIEAVKDTKIDLNDKIKEDPVKLISDKITTDLTNKSEGAKAESAKIIESEKSNSLLKESSVKDGAGSEKSSDSAKTVTGSDLTSVESDKSKVITTGTETDKKIDESINKTATGTDENNKSKEFTVTAVKEAEKANEKNEPILKEAEPVKDTEILSDNAKKSEVKQPNLKEIGKISSVKDTDAVDGTKEAVLKEVVKDVKSKEPNLKDSTKSFLANEQKATIVQDVPKKVEEPTKTAEDIKPVEVTKPVEVKKPEEAPKPELKPEKKPTEANKVPQKDEKVPEVVISEPNVIKPAPEAPSSSTETKPTLQRSRKKLMEAKPPNVLVYSDSTTTRDNVIKTLGGILKESMYTIYPLSIQQVRERIWLDNTTLLVVCGGINGSDISQIFLEYFFKGGKILCLCSDLLRQVLPTYHTAEVREHELVQFSYGQWKNIKMMHHIFCYQPSPIRKHFSQDSDDPPKEKANGNPSIELKDDLGMNHNVHVQILGTEDTWKTPSLLMVYTDNGGKIIFSQIHLEIDPSFYENDEQKYQILMKNDNLRHEIFGDVLSTHLGLATSDMKVRKKEGDVQFSKGYFLGRHELKFEILENLKPFMEDNTLKVDGLSIKFCGKNVDPPSPESYCLPVMIHSCPDDFSTLDYFDTLKTSSIGRALIYSHILTSSMSMINKMNYCHGLAIVSRVLTQATGRAKNTWLSPEGCLMFTIQLHIPLKSPLGQRLPLVQHLIATAAVMGIKNIPGYEGLDINVKWPNDIYANGERKIGGLIVNSTIEADQAICNIGLGLNLSNSIPTTCINDMILEYNKKHSKNLKPLTLEKTLAIIFNEIENILNRIQADDIDYLYNLYYSCWLHTDTSVKVLSSSGQEKNGKILGLDEYGFLKIRLDNNQIESVQPDGNSFDMLRGLIVPKAH